MVVLETLTVAGSVAAIISGFNSAKSLFQDWRAHRKAKKRSHDEDRVEQSLAHNPDKVTTAYGHGFRSLGNRFAEGDGTLSAMETVEFR
jgi:hypothetical protein